jgi:hypothetical protein
MRNNFTQSDECRGKIQSVYDDTLRRWAQTAEVDYWRNMLDVSGWTIKSMRSAFTQSQECGNRIVDVYTATLERTPQTWEIDAWDWARCILGIAARFEHSRDGQVARELQQFRNRTPVAEP